MTTTEQQKNLRKLAADTPTSDPRKRAMIEAADMLEDQDQTIESLNYELMSWVDVYN